MDCLYLQVKVLSYKKIKTSEEGHHLPVSAIATVVEATVVEATVEEATVVEATVEDLHNRHVITVAPD